MNDLLRAFDVVPDGGRIEVLIGRVATEALALLGGAFGYAPSGGVLASNLCCGALLRMTL